MSFSVYRGFGSSQLDCVLHVLSVALIMLIIGYQAHAHYACHVLNNFNQGCVDVAGSVLSVLDYCCRNAFCFEVKLS